MDEDTSSISLQLSLQKLKLAAEYYSGISGGMARFFTKETQRMAEELNSKGLLHSRANTDTCRYCGNLFRPDNSSVKLLRSLRLNKRLSRILRKAEKMGTKRLTSLQKQLCEMYASAGTRVAVRCQCCFKTSIKFQSSKRIKANNTTKTEEIKETPLTKSQKKKLKKKKKFQTEQTNNSHAGAFVGNRDSPQSKQGQSVTSSYSTQHVSKSLQQSKVFHKLSLPKQETPTTVSVSKKKKLTALGKLLEKEKNERLNKSSGTGLSSFLSSL